MSFMQPWVLLLLIPLAAGVVWWILRERRGTGGFGYDPIFEPYGSSRTTAEMDAIEKDAISHRGQAFRALVPVLAELLADSAP